MPIGVPRIIYCWGEELPAQWTDIYNFIFRRRMVFLMQYLDDELCNQICGLLINIHMEDRSKEMEKKEMERSGVFKSGVGSSSDSSKGKSGKPESSFNKVGPKDSAEDLLNADEDLGIEDIDSLEQYTLQKITTEWLNWNAQFFDYSDEPYLFYLAELLSKDFQQNNSSLNSGAYPSDNGTTPRFASGGAGNEMTQLLQMLKKNSALMNSNTNEPLDVYSPFRKNANFGNFGNLQGFEESIDLSFQDLNPLSPRTKHGGTGKEQLFKMFNQLESKTKTSSLLDNFKKMSLLLNNKANKKNRLQSSRGGVPGSTGAGYESQNLSLSNLLSDFSKKDFMTPPRLQSPRVGGGYHPGETPPKGFPGGTSAGKQFGQKALSQRQLRANYSLDSNSGSNEFRSYYRKQTERALIEEESKKVFVIINSFGGSVGNGVTVHDALQFIKAGSLTLGLGVAASAASLALAGGTIGERYVTEGCHVMIHQPEGGLQGQASDIWIDSQEIMKIRLDVAEIYSLSTYRPRHKILRDLDRDFYLTATETIHYGLADEIATNEVMHEIIEMTSKVWDYHDSKQQRLLETRERASSGLDTQTQN